MMRTSGVPTNVAVRKRAQIAKESRTMFVWVAVASVLVGFAVVASIFLARMLLFNEKVLQVKQQTIANLQTDNDAITPLENKVRALDANEALISAKANSSDETLQVVLDALPSTANSLALGSSLQNKLLNISGVTLDSLQVDPVSGVETSSDASTANTTSTTSDNSISDSNTITFTFSVTGSDSDLQKVLSNLEKSIRTIDVVSVKIESQSGGQETMTIQALAFYEPTKTLKLTNEVVTQ